MGQKAKSTKGLRGFALLPPLTRPPKGACPFATWQAVRGRAPLTTSPERWGRSRASRSGPLRGRCANLDPLPLRRPAVALWRVSSGRRVKGLVRPAAPQGRGLGPLTRLERPQPHVSGGRGRSSPCPPSPRRQEWGVQRGKAPMGKGRRPAASHKNRCPEGRHSQGRRPCFSGVRHRLGQSPIEI